MPVSKFTTEYFITEVHIGEMARSKGVCLSYDQSEEMYTRVSILKGVTTRYCTYDDTLTIKSKCRATTKAAVNTAIARAATYLGELC